MADFVVPRHSAVMERLRRRIELFRRHHNSCEKRYDNTTMERLELERQQTFALHQRCLQTKAKRSNKHRQTQSGTDQAAQRVSGTGASNADLADSGTPGEQSRNSTLIALQETVKRKLGGAGSPLGRDQVNGFGDAYPQAKKSCLEESLGGLKGAPNGVPPPLSPLDSKRGVTADALVLNGSHAPAVSEANGAGLGDVRGTEPDLRLKQEMKQEPMDDILPAGGGNGNIILPDLNLNEQEWTELMEEFNRSVPYEEIQELFNDGFDDRKDPDGPTGAPAGAAATVLLPPDLVKAEYSPVAAASFEQDSRTGSPQVPSGATGPHLHAGSPAAAPSAASSPALPVPQAVAAPRQGQVPQAGQTPRQLQTHLLPGPPKDLSPAQHLQQLAAREQQRTQRMQSQHKPPQPQPKFQQQQQQQQPGCPSAWPQPAPTQSPLGSAFGLDKPASPSLYPPDFQNPKSLLMAGQQASKGSPKAGAPGGYMQPSGHPMLGHPTAPSGALGHPPGAGGQAAMLDYNNTKPLSHFEAGAPGLPRGPGAQTGQSKATLLNILQQQQQQQMKQRPPGMPFRPPTHMAHPQQEPGTYQPVPHVPGNSNTMATQPGGGGGGGMATSHSTAAYLSSLQKQQQLQMMSPQQKFLLNQHRQIMAEQEKQRQQQEQQLQRHLTRPPPQYQDQQNQSASQIPFQPQPQVSQFSGSSQPIGGVNSLGGPAPNTQRMFTQTQGMMGMSQGGGPSTGAPPAASQADMSLSSCAGGLDMQQVLYGNMPMHNQQRVPMAAAYRQNLLAQQQTHLKNQPNANMLKQQQQQQLARLPNSMPSALANNMSAAMPSSMAGGIQGAMPPQAQSWQPQPHPGLQQGMAGQPNSSNGVSFPATGFHMQARMPKLPGSGPFAQAGMGNGAAARAMAGMNPGQMMPGMAQQRTSNAGMGQQLPPPNQQQAPQVQPPPQPQQVLPDLGPFGQPQGGQVPNRTAGMQCNQAYQVNRTASQQLPFGYSTQAAGSMSSFPGESDLVDSLLKNQTTQEWMDDLDELLASHQ